jgi:hypothetical protein
MHDLLHNVTYCGFISCRLRYCVLCAVLGLRQGIKEAEAQNAAAAAEQGAASSNGNGVPANAAAAPGQVATKEQ